MNVSPPYFQYLHNALPAQVSTALIRALHDNHQVRHLARNDALIEYQSGQRKLFFVVSGSFVRNIITSRGEEKTVMFHTEAFHPYIKSYDVVYQHSKTTYEVKANEPAVVIELDYALIERYLTEDSVLLRYFTEQTEALLSTFDTLRNYQLGLTTEEYLDWLQRHYAFVFERFPAHRIASFMGITPVWLSKLKKRHSS